MNNLEYIEKQLKEIQEPIEAAVLGNRVKDIEHYRFQAGVIHGLALAFEVIKEALDSHEDNDSEN